MDDSTRKLEERADLAEREALEALAAAERTLAAPPPTSLAAEASPKPLQVPMPPVKPPRPANPERFPINEAAFPLPSWGHSWDERTRRCVRCGMTQVDFYFHGSGTPCMAAMPGYSMAVPAPLAYSMAIQAVTKYGAGPEGIPSTCGNCSNKEACDQPLKGAYGMDAPTSCLHWDPSPQEWKPRPVHRVAEPEILLKNVSRSKIFFKDPVGYADPGETITVPESYLQIQALRLAISTGAMVVKEKK